MNIPFTTLAMATSGAASKYTDKFDYPLAFNVTLVGISVVFSALLILAFCVSFYSNIFTAITKIKNKKINDVKPTSVAKQPQEATSEKIADEELIAVLTAAIAASLKNQPNCNLRVKSFKRINQSAPSWNKAGRNDYISSRM